MSPPLPSLVVLLIASAGLNSQPRPALTLEVAIPLPDVQGRIDHLAIDAAGQRLFVAALGNNTVEVIDLKSNRRAATITGLAEPQGVLYLARPGRLYVANGQSGAVRIFDGATLRAIETIGYGGDADNLRYDSAHERVYVGYGSGALGQFTPEGKKISEIQLDAHPESFQLENNGPRIFVNLPKSRTIAVVDRVKQTVVSRWTAGGPQANYPMALDESHHRLFVLCRQPARLVVLDTNSGHLIATVPTVGDADDVFYDAGRKLIYAIGGQGAVWIHEQQDADHYPVVSEIATVTGARTGLFSPDLDRLYVAVRRQGAQPAGIRVYRPQR